MKILLDTCVLSELRVSHGNALVRSALDHFDAKDLFISVITIAEITKGIALLPSSERKTSLTHWSISLENSYADRILNINREVAHIWGELTANAQKCGKIIPAADGLIAATALAHGLHVMTRNVNDFKHTGVLLINPWED